jgi:hypothetical protein
MKISLLRGTAVSGLFTLLLSGCVVPVGGGYEDGGVSVGLGVDYYEPYGAVYGGWGPGYRVAPYRGGDYHQDRGSRPVSHAYRPAPEGHSMPSLPSRGHSGGSGGSRRH